ncbi:putative B3 domain-containing protein At5g66980 [Solanum stenotomum]|uniref:putative B3 domain-containing protein At5g66980 n=1 Tax=Solanum stenotomum TaxID=172797 RepID=UPI0020D10CFD|nr:putative B3 domain-containing protein At5g66980 [Solanum stenotomum]
MEKRKRGRPTKNIKPLISEEKGKHAVAGTSSPVSRRRPEFFKLFLSDRSSQQLVLPKDFSRKYGENMKERSKIKDLCGNVWDVCVEKSEDGVVIFIGKGWEDFIKYQSLKNGYFLIFIYDDEGDSSFTVKVFTTNGCKKSVPMTIQKNQGRDHVIYKY